MNPFQEIPWRFNPTSLANVILTVWLPGLSPVRLLSLARASHHRRPPSLRPPALSRHLFRWRRWSSRPLAKGAVASPWGNIKLKGVEITDCDTLVVDGMVEATIDSRLMQISEQGSFRGAADIDLAEIKGRFEGSLNVRGKLIIHATGQVSGKIRYAKLIVEDGGQLSGDIECGLGTSPTAARAGAGVTLPAQIADAVPKSVLVV